MDELPSTIFKYWRHSHEEDLSPYLLYRPGDHPFPASRWRDGFTVNPSGVFVQDSPHPSDAGIVKQRGSWEAEGANRLRAHAAGQSRVLNIESVGEKELLLWPEHAVPGAYVFETSYVNYAWGYQHSGLVIESSFGAYAYDYGEGDPTWEDPSGGAFSADELSKKYAPGRRFLARVPLDELVAMQALIEPASKGPYSTPQSGGADRGQTHQVAFLFDPDTATHRPVLLAADGDLISKNLSEEAQTLLDRLSKIGRTASAPGRRP